MTIDTSGALRDGALHGRRKNALARLGAWQHTAVVAPGVLGANGGLTNGGLSAVGFAAVGRAVGPALRWLVVLAIFVVGTLGVSRLVGGSRWARLPAVALYGVIPFVFNRLYAGHLALLMGYALLPLVVVSALRAPGRRGVAALAPALWWAVLTALSPHYAWIYGAVVLISFAVGAMELPPSRLVPRGLGGVRRDEPLHPPPPQRDQGPDGSRRDPSRPIQDHR